VTRGAQTAENPTHFAQDLTLEAQRSGVPGPKPPALSAELRACARRHRTGLAKSGLTTVEPPFQSKLGRWFN